jgi:hypothetical protein
VFERRILRKIFGLKRKNVGETEENYTIKSFMLCILHQL